MAGTDPTGPGTVTGDPHFRSFCGVVFDFHGEHGKTYTFINVDGVVVTGRMAALEGGVSYCDRITIQYPDHQVVADVDGVTIDGGPVLDEHRTGNDWVHVREHTIGEDGWVETRHGGWAICAYRRAGTEADLAGGVLEGIAHLELHVEGVPASLGLMFGGHGEVDPQDFVVS